MPRRFEETFSGFASKEIAGKQLGPWHRLHGPAQELRVTKQHGNLPTNLVSAWHPLPADSSRHCMECGRGPSTGNFMMQAVVLPEQNYWSPRIKARQKRKQNIRTSSLSGEKKMFFGMLGRSEQRPVLVLIWLWVKQKVPKMDRQMDTSTKTCGPIFLGGEFPTSLCGVLILIQPAIRPC